MVVVDDDDDDDNESRAYASLASCTLLPMRSRPVCALEWRHVANRTNFELLVAWIAGFWSFACSQVNAIVISSTTRVIHLGGTLEKGWLRVECWLKNCVLILQSLWSIDQQLAILGTLFKLKKTSGREEDHFNAEYQLQKLQRSLFYDPMGGVVF